MRTVKRILVVLILGLVVFAVWAAISKTPWAGTVDPLTAGSNFTHPIEPLRELAGALLVAVPSVLLIRSAWAWFARVVLGRETHRRVPTQRTAVRSRSSRGEVARELVRNR
jgi:hypothetical protein